MGSNACGDIAQETSTYTYFWRSFSANWCCFNLLMASLHFSVSSSQACVYVYVCMHSYSYHHMLSSPCKQAALVNWPWSLLIPVNACARTTNRFPFFQLLRSRLTSKTALWHASLFPRTHRQSRLTFFSDASAMHSARTCAKSWSILKKTHSQLMTES